ncbi:hypothetical protein CVIRNUC_009350 [Coccomyxa viridis]|uniref:Uncharacterized protein n=1 Tax=Coccomyxa viridis TaxID=1274662 RepID=A0AAV1IG61_9CHLO|nr:hypothetical protein CVIRNUC_009350 [Coccomyxa viridis]
MPQPSYALQSPAKGPSNAEPDRREGFVYVNLNEARCDTIYELCIDKLSEQIEDLAAGKDAAESQLADCTSKLVTSEETIKGLRDKLNAAEVAKEAALEREQKSTTAAQLLVEATKAMVNQWQAVSTSMGSASVIASKFATEAHCA